MGEARRRKLLGKSKHEQFSIHATTEVGQNFLATQGRRKHGIEKMVSDITREKMVAVRVFNNEHGEFFFYDMENPEAETPLRSLLDRLKQKFRSPSNVPLWLASLVMEEPWEQASRGYAVRVSEVWELHANFPDCRVTPEETWNMVELKGGKAQAEYQQKDLDAVTARGKENGHQSCRI